jgi:hypothetical protein
LPSASSLACLPCKDTNLHLCHQTILPHKACENVFFTYASAWHTILLSDLRGNSIFHHHLNPIVSLIPIGEREDFQICPNESMFVLCDETYDGKSTYLVSEICNNTMYLLVFFSTFTHIVCNVMRGHRLSLCHSVKHYETLKVLSLCRRFLIALMKSVALGRYSSIISLSQYTKSS